MKKAILIVVMLLFFPVTSMPVQVPMIEDNFLDCDSGRCTDDISCGLGCICYIPYDEMYGQCLKE